MAPQWLTYAYKEMEKPENFILGLNSFIYLCGKTQEHISRMMNKYYNCTPSEYINNLRLQQATKLLIATEKNITDIIYEVGFNNASYFNELFKTKYGLNPKNYRKINRRIINPLD
jgi:AraC family cel operon transcriptional repressor